MKSRLFFRSAIGIGLLVVALSAASAALANGNNVRGTVLKSGKPLRSAWVIVSQSGVEKGRSLTGSDGRYYIGSLGGGGYQIRVEGQTYNANIRLPDNSLYNINIP